MKIIHRPFTGAIFTLFAMVALRMLLHQSLHFAFLFWNVFLAALPLVLARIAHTRRNPAQGILLSLLWLPLFPNAAYLVTDIVHLRITETPRFWLDLVILFSAGALGIVLGLQSLFEMERFYARFFAPRQIRLISIGVLILSGYGIYLGRVERWNSWDPLLQPLSLLRDIFDDVRHPLRNRQAWQLTAVFAFMQLSCYFLMKNRISAK